MSRRRERPCPRRHSDSSIEAKRFAGHRCGDRSWRQLAALSLTAPARADLQFCNKTSYVLDLALALEEKDAAATRGWFRVDPGACRTVLQGAITAEKVYVHARALAAYGPSPLPQAGHADFCIADGNFVIAAAKACQTRSGPAARALLADQAVGNRAGADRLSAARKPTTIPRRRGLPASSACWSIAGYDANPIDGLEGKKTSAALDQFLKDRRLPADAANGPTFFQVMLDAVKAADGVGFSWCNETSYPVMAALGIDEKRRGDDARLVPRRRRQMRQAGPAGEARQALFSFAEAVDKEGQSLKRGDRLLDLGRPDAALHPRRALRDFRAEELRRAGADRDRFRGDRHGGEAGRDGAVSGMTGAARAAKTRAPCPAPAPARSAPRDFAHVETWVFDLDNTLYPHHLNLWQQVDERIRTYIADFLKVSQDDAFRVQKDYYKRYGTSMRGMMTEHGMDPDAYLAFVHQIDHSPLEPNPALGAAIEQLPGRKLILTNGTRAHADAVMRRLDIHMHFEDVFGINEAELEPKPLPQTYDRFLKAHGVDPARAAMFEDLARNLEVPHTLGMTTVLVVPEGSREVVREAWEMEGRDAPHVDHVTDDLTGFLGRISHAALTYARPGPDKPQAFSHGISLECPTSPRPSTTPSRSATT